MMIIQFRVIGYVCEEFISSAIARLSKKLKLSEAVAGATLIALANGATDILTVIITTDPEAAANDIAIGSLFGGSFFAATFILGIVIISSKQKMINDVGSKQ